MNANTAGTIKRQCQLLLLAVMLAFGAAGAQANPPNLVGTWINTEGNAPIGSSFPFTLLGDGTANGKVMGGQLTSWNVKGDSLMVNTSGGYIYRFKFKLSGKKLTLAGEFGTGTYEDMTESVNEAVKKLIGSWIRINGKLDAQVELLDGGTGTIGGSPITWKVTVVRHTYSNKINGELEIVKKIKGKETVGTYSFMVNTEAPSLYYGLELEEYIENAKKSGYMKKENLDEIKQGLGSFTDDRDKKKYKSVKINGKTWMAENLNFKADSSLCYGKKDANCKTYGRLYTWEAAKTACPAGWHLPKKEDWEALLKLERMLAPSTPQRGDEQGNDKAGETLRSKTGWPKIALGIPNYNGTDVLGFSALPGGYRKRDEKNSVIFEGTPPSKDYAAGRWWLDQDKGEFAEFFGMMQTVRHSQMGVGEKTKWVPEYKSSPISNAIFSSSPKTDALSVRCVQD